MLHTQKREGQQVGIPAPSLAPSSLKRQTVQVPTGPNHMLASTSAWLSGGINNSPAWDRERVHPVGATVACRVDRSSKKSPQKLLGVKRGGDEEANGVATLSATLISPKHERSNESTSRTVQSRGAKNAAPTSSCASLTRNRYDFYRGHFFFSLLFFYFYHVLPNEIQPV